MILRWLHVFYGSLRQNLHHMYVYSGVPHVNRGETGKMQVYTLDSGWIHLKVGIQCGIFGRAKLKTIANLFLLSPPLNEKDLFLLKQSGHF